MAKFRLEFSGNINKCEFKTIGNKALATFSVCRKNYTKADQPPSFTWINVNLWEPPEWMIPKIVKGNFVAGSGEFTLRSYEKDGKKDKTADVKCNSFDVDFSSDPESAHEAPSVSSAPTRPRPAPAGGDDEIPF